MVLCATPQWLSLHLASGPALGLPLVIPRPCKAKTTCPRQMRTCIPRTGRSQGHSAYSHPICLTQPRGVSPCFPYSKAFYGSHRMGYTSPPRICPQLCQSLPLPAPLPVRPFLGLNLHPFSTLQLHPPHHQIAALHSGPAHLSARWASFLRSPPVPFLGPLQGAARHISFRTDWD